MPQPLEQMLSPIIKNRSITAEENKHSVTDREIVLIEKIKKQKYDVLHKSISPSQVDLVRPEIIESWLRSYNYGLDLFKINQAPSLDKEAFAELLREKDLLIRTADIYIRQLKNMLYNINCVIVLSDEQGVVLSVLEGKDNSVNEQNHMRPGVIWNEQTVGTCAHGLCLLLESPIQICGPEHYCESFNYTTASSAPIFDVNHNLLGTLSIAGLDYANQNEHTLGFTVSMAWAIQNELRLSGNDELFYATLEAYQEAVLTINKNGVITKANKLANNIFSHLHQSLAGSCIDEVLGHQPLIKSVLETGKPLLDAQIEIEKRNLKLHLHSVQPVKNNFNKVIGCVLNLKKIDRPRKTGNQINTEKTGFTFDQIIGSSPQIIKTIEMTKKFAAIEANILIEGESGTGKEVYAQAIHNERCPQGPFIGLNCAAIPKNLIESELFGYEGGSFTGAERQGRPGKIELANGGTLFLDEIGDMPLELQPVLLRVLEEKRIMRIGGNKYIPIDFNLVAATNKDLLQLGRNNQFREDLYYRLAVFKIYLPPLRERGPDVIRLAKYFINKVAARQQLAVPYLSEETKNILIQYSWPGNIRQLENAMLYAVNISTGGVIHPDDLPDEIKGISYIPSNNQGNTREKVTTDKATNNNLSIKEMEKIAIIQALNQTGNNIGEAAKIIGFSKTTMYRKIRDYDIDVPVRTKNA